MRHKPRGLKEAPTSKTAPSSKPEPPFGEEIQHEKLRVSVQQKAVLWSVIICEGLKAELNRKLKRIYTHTCIRGTISTIKKSV